MLESSLLSWIVFTPAIGAVVVMLLGSADAVKRAALAVSGVTFFLSLLTIGPFLGGNAGSPAYGELQIGQRVTWIATADDSFRVEYFLGVDGLSMPLVVLTAFITFLACAASWNFESWKTQRGLKGYMCLLLLLETGMLGVFVALDFFLFFVFWEVMLVPMYFLIGIWGGPRREYAAIKFFLFTLAGSVLMLVAMLAFYFYVPAASGMRTFDLLKLAAPAYHAIFESATFLGYRFDIAMFVLLFVGFAVKMPIFPLHTWLPDAHVEAPTPVSMILAGVLLKMGGYGMLRICYPILPEAGAALAVLLGGLGVINILYGALCAMAQDDFKKLVAYSSISHMGYVLLGMASMTATGMGGAMFQMIAHGISSPMCFFLVGVLYDRTHQRDIGRFGGLWNAMPRYGSLATIGFFASLGLPALCGFIGEVMAVLGAFDSRVLASAGGYHVIYGVLGALGAVLAAGYILWMMQRVYLGAARPEHAGIADIDRRETLILAPLAALCIILGVLPKQTVLDFVSGTLSGMLALANG